MNRDKVLGNVLDTPQNDQSQLNKDELALISITETFAYQASGLQRSGNGCHAYTRTIGRSNAGDCHRVFNNAIYFNSGLNRAR